MQVRTLELLAGVGQAVGWTVVIDVFRAFSVAPLAIAAGARCIHPVASPEEALALKAEHPDWLLMGERDGRPLPGFDFGNSPAEIMAADLSNRVLVQRTSAGVQGLLAAASQPGVTRVFSGSFVNALALIDYLRGAGPGNVSLLAMGWNGTDPTLEDRLCAEFLAAGLRGDALPDMRVIRDRLRRDPSGAKFFDPARPWFRSEDFELCVAPPSVDKVLVLEQPDHGPPALVVAASG